MHFGSIKIGLRMPNGSKMERVKRVSRLHLSLIFRILMIILAWYILEFLCCLKQIQLG